MALANLLGKTSSKIHALTLNNLYNRTHDDCMTILCNTIIKNNTLRILHLTEYIFGRLDVHICSIISPLELVGIIKAQEY